jgi:hypothetical protein
MRSHARLVSAHGAPRTSRLYSPRQPLAAGSRRTSLAATQQDAPQPPPLAVGLVGGVVGTLLAAALVYLQDGDDSLLESSTSGLTPGDVAGAALWSLSLFYASPWQLLIFFLGKLDVERPSDRTLYVLGRASGQPVDEAAFEAPALLKALNASLFLAAGSALSLSLSNALGGESTWSVSTGVGACLASAVYELGRPPRLSGEAQSLLEDQWQHFRGFAESWLERRPGGRCHESEVAKAYATHCRRAPLPGVASANRSAGLRNFVSNYAPEASRSAGGYWKGLSVRSTPFERNEAPADAQYRDVPAQSSVQ